MICYISQSKLEKAVRYSLKGGKSFYLVFNAAGIIDYGMYRNSVVADYIFGIVKIKLSVDIKSYKPESCGNVVVIKILSLVSRLNISENKLSLCPEGVKSFRFRSVLDLN